MQFFIYFQYCLNNFNAISKMWYSLEIWKSSDSECNFCRQCFVLFHTKNIFCFVCYCPVVVAIYTMCGCCWIFWVVMRIYNILGECFVEWRTYKKKVLCSKFCKNLLLVACIFYLLKFRIILGCGSFFEDYAYSCRRIQWIWKFLKGKRA